MDYTAKAIIAKQVAKKKVKDALAAGVAAGRTGDPAKIASAVSQVVGTTKTQKAKNVESLIEGLIVASELHELSEIADVSARVCGEICHGSAKDGTMVCQKKCRDTDPSRDHAEEYSRIDTKTGERSSITREEYEEKRREIERKFEVVKKHILLFNQGIRNIVAKKKNVKEADARKAVMLAAYLSHMNELLKHLDDKNEKGGICPHSMTVADLKKRFLFCALRKISQFLRREKGVTDIRDLVKRTEIAAEYVAAREEDKIDDENLESIAAAVRKHLSMTETEVPASTIAELWRQPASGGLLKLHVSEDDYKETIGHLVQKYPDYMDEFGLRHCVFGEESQCNKEPFDLYFSDIIKGRPVFTPASRDMAVAYMVQNGNVECEGEVCPKTYRSYPVNFICNE